MDENKLLLNELVNLFAIAQTLNQLTIPNFSIQTDIDTSIRLRVLLSSIQNKLEFKKEYYCYNIFQMTAINCLELINLFNSPTQTIDLDKLKKEIAILHSHIGLGLAIIASSLENKDLELTKIDIDELDYSTTLISTILKKIGYNDITKLVIFWKEKVFDEIIKNDVKSLYYYIKKQELEEFEIIKKKKTKELNQDLDNIIELEKNISDKKNDYKKINETISKRFDLQNKFFDLLKSSEYEEVANIYNNLIVEKDIKNNLIKTNLTSVKVNGNNEYKNINENDAIISYLKNLSDYEFQAKLKEYNISDEEIWQDIIEKSRAKGILALIRKGFSLYNICSFVLDLLKEEIRVEKIVSFLAGSLIDKFLDVKTLGLWSVGKLFFNLITGSYEKPRFAS